MHKIPNSCLLATLFFTIPMNAESNMSLPSEGTTDPHLHHFEGKFWLYTGHDVDPTSEDWVMPNWRIFSSPDLVTWTLEQTISPKDNYMPDDSDKCWAPDAAERNGNYYFYFSNHNIDVGVMRAGQPGGTYHEVGNTPLLPKSLSEGLEFDPTIFVDDDENRTPYIVYGYKGRGGYYIAQLKENMVELHEKPKAIMIENDKSPNIDKNYLHKRDDTYYLSFGGYYSTSKNVYGPYQYQGLTGEGHGLGKFSHGSFLSFEGQWYHVWTRYFDRSKSKYRESLITYAHYDEAGNLYSDTGYLDNYKEWGVGQYSADWKKIEAEWYFSSSDIKKAQHHNGKGFYLTEFDHEDYVVYPNIRSMKGQTTLSFNIRGQGGTLDVHLDDSQGKKIASCEIQASNNFSVQHCTLKVSEGDNSLVFVYKDAPNNKNIDLDWFHIH